MAEENENPEEEGKGGGGSKRLIGIVVILLVFIGAQVGIAMWAIKALTPEDPTLAKLQEEEQLKMEKKLEQTRMGVTLDAPIEVTVNIHGTNGTRYLKTSIQLEYDLEYQQTLGPELDRRKPKIKDIIINILTSKPLVELQTKKGKEDIRNAIKSDINMILPENIGSIRSCYFDEFVIQ